jgi:large subunit ribosomal protein L21
MYAIIETGGKQYKVAPGDVLDLEHIKAAPDDVIDFDKVLAVSGEEGSAAVFGTPHVDGAKVSAKLVAQRRDRKVTVLKFRHRTGYRRKQGHRQALSRVEIVGIEPGNG